MKNATFLTQNYPRNEKGLWTPCIYDFFCRCKPDLPVAAYIRSPSGRVPVYESRQHSPILRVDDGEVLREPGLYQCLAKIDAMFGMGLTVDPGRYPPRGDIAGIAPDIVVLHRDKPGMCIIENKPYYESHFAPHQGPGGAYIDFVSWLNGKEVPTEYMVIHSSSWSEYLKVKKLQDELQKDRPQSYFGSLLLEDIFLQMARHKFTYSPVAERWEDFTDKSPDFA